MIRINKRITALSVAAVLAVAGGTVAIQQTNTGAEELPEIYVQVGEHEERIDTLETRADGTDAAVTQTQEAVTQLQTQQTATQSAPAPSTPQTPAPAPTDPVVTEPTPPQPAPTPPPVIDPFTIMAMTYTVEGGYNRCDYTLYSAAADRSIGIVLQPLSVACYGVGTVLPRE